MFSPGRHLEGFDLNDANKIRQEIRGLNVVMFLDAWAEFEDAAMPYSDLVVHPNLWLSPDLKGSKSYDAGLR